MKKSLFAVLLVTLFSIGCVSTAYKNLEQYGDTINKGDTKNDVITKLGEPKITNDIGDSGFVGGWYALNTNFVHYIPIVGMFVTHKSMNRTITFDKAGKVTAISKTDSGF